MKAQLNNCKWQNENFKFAIRNLHFAIEPAAFMRAEASEFIPQDRLRTFLALQYRNVLQKQLHICNCF